MLQNFSKYLLAAIACLIVWPSLAVAQQAPDSPPPSEQQDIRVYRTVLSPKIVSDVFGKRIGQNFIAIQVTVANRNDRHQYLIHDLSIDLSGVFELCNAAERTRVEEANQQLSQAEKTARKAGLVAEDARRVANEQKPFIAKAEQVKKSYDAAEQRATEASQNLESKKKAYSRALEDYDRLFRQVRQKEYELDIAGWRAAGAKRAAEDQRLKAKERNAAEQQALTFTNDVDTRKTELAELKSKLNLAQQSLESALSELRKAQDEDELASKHKFESERSLKEANSAKRAAEEAEQIAKQSESDKAEADEKLEKARGAVKALEQQQSLNCLLSSAELSVTRGVAEVGQNLSKRNFFFRLFRGAGTVAAGLIGVSSFGPAYPKSVAVFNGPLLSAYADVLPDLTLNQVNRLNDTAYASNTLVPKESAKVMVVFVPQSIFMNGTQRKRFWNEPVEVLTREKDGTLKKQDFVNWPKLQVVVKGTFIQELVEGAPSNLFVALPEDEAKKLQQPKGVAKGQIQGRSLSEAELIPDPKVEGVAIERLGASDDKSMNFTITTEQPIPRGKELPIQVKNSKGSAKTSIKIQYLPDAPEIVNVEQAWNGPRTKVTLSISGKNFIPADTQLTPIDDLSDCKLQADQSSATLLVFTCTVKAKVEKKSRFIHLSASGQPSTNRLQFELSPPDK